MSQDIIEIRERLNKDYEMIGSNPLDVATRLMVLSREAANLAVLAINVQANRSRNDELRRELAGTREALAIENPELAETGESERPAKRIFRR